MKFNIHRGNHPPRAIKMPALVKIVDPQTAMPLRKVQLSDVLRKNISRKRGGRCSVVQGHAAFGIRYYYFASHCCGFPGGPHRGVRGIAFSIEGEYSFITL
jgi:hypothetical protein